MKSYLQNLAVLLFLLCFALHSSAQVAGGAAAERVFRLFTGRKSALDIEVHYYIGNPSVERTAKNLRLPGDYSIVYRGVSADSAAVSGLVRALERHETANFVSFQVVWVVLFKQGETTVREVMLDKSGAAGTIDGQKLKFAPDFADWALERLDDAFVLKHTEDALRQRAKVRW